MELAGLLLGVVLTAAVLWGVLWMRPAQARVAAVLAGLGLLAAAGTVLLARDGMTRGFGSVYLLLGLLAGLLPALPRRVRWGGREPLWVSLGSGLACVLLLVLIGQAADASLALLLPAQAKAQASSGMVNGMVLAALPLVGLATVVAVRTPARF